MENKEVIKIIENAPVNFYMYAKYIGNRVGIRECMQYMNEHFEKKYKKPLGAFLTEEGFWEPNRERIEDFRDLIDVVMTRVHRHLGIQFGTAFKELWSWSPTHEVLTLLAMIDLPKMEYYDRHIGSDDVILETIVEAVNEGWLTFNGLDHDRQNLSSELCGRLSLGAFDLYDPGDRSGLMEIERTKNLPFRIRKKCPFDEPYEEPEKFWAAQLSKNPHKVVEAFIHTVFYRYTRKINYCQYVINYIHQYKWFYEATQKALLLLIKHGKEELLSYFPKYAGYSKVENGRAWLEKLYAVLIGDQEISFLGKWE